MFSSFDLHLSLEGHQVATGHWTRMFPMKEKVQWGQTDRNEAEGVDGAKQASLCSDRDTGRKGDDEGKAVHIWQRRENRQMCLELVDTQLIFPSQPNAWQERLKGAFEKECCTLTVSVWLSCPISWAPSLCVCACVCTPEWVCVYLCVCEHYKSKTPKIKCFHNWRISQQPFSIIICIFSLMSVQHCEVLTACRKLH